MTDSCKTYQEDMRTLNCRFGEFMVTSEALRSIGLHAIMKLRTSAKVRDHKREDFS